MHVLVTGSAGRVGRRVVPLLLARGDTVRGFDLRPLGLSHHGYGEVIGAFDDPDAVERAMRDAQAVLHLGAFMSWLPRDAAAVYTANATGTFHMLAAASKSRVARVVFASTGEVYPEVRAKYQPVDEAHPREPTSVYGLSKLVAEEMVAFFHRAHGLPYVILRFAHTQDAAELLDAQSFFSGPRFYLHGKIRQQRELGNAEALRVLEPLDDGRERHLVQCAPDGTPYRMMIADARDIAQGVVLALDAPGALNATLNLGPDEPIAFDRAVALLQAKTGLAVVRARMPGAPVNYATSNGRARDLLGFRPRFTFAAMVDDAAR
ncbi:MAG TPA: NAD(P)-dependent oxidoreductase [Casimicrobiaceae bacterium]|nr:NAD(P)-dependent oxidoreductase [Casimicrobiaceae bacterium]